MKKILFILLAFAFFKSDAQHLRPSNYTSVNQRYLWEAGLFNALGIPAGTSAEFRAGQAIRAGALYYDSTGIDSGLYVYSGLSWQKAGSGIDTTSLSNRINLKVNISDTAAMLAPYLYGFNNIGSTPNAQGASVGSHLITLQPADSSFGGVVSTGTQRWRGQKTILNKLFITQWDPGVGKYFGVTINHPFSTSSTVDGLRMGYNGGTGVSYIYSRTSANVDLPLHFQGSNLIFAATDTIGMHKSGSLSTPFINASVAPDSIIMINNFGGLSKAAIGSGLAYSSGVLSTTSPSTPNTIYSANDTLVDSRQVDMKGYSLEFLNSGLFRIQDTAGTVQGTYDFNEGIDFVVANTAKSLGIKADVINGIINQATNISTGDISFIKTDVDSLILRNDNETGTHFRIADYAGASNGDVLKLADNTTGRVEWGASGSGSPTYSAVYINGDYTVASGVTHVQVYGGPAVITLPTASSNSGRAITVSTHYGGSFAATNSPAAVYDGTNTNSTMLPGSSYTFISDGTNWNKVRIGAYKTYETHPSATGENLFSSATGDDVDDHVEFGLLKGIKGDGSINVSTVSQDIVISRGGNWARTTSNHTLVDNTTDQPIFPSANDAWTVEASTLYRVKGLFHFNMGATTHTTSIGFTLGGGASVTRISIGSNSWNNAPNASNTAQVTNYITQAAASPVTLFNTATTLTVWIDGEIAVNAAGTITPFVKFSTATGGTVETVAGSFFEMVKIGTTGQTSNGNVN